MITEERIIEVANRLFTQNGVKGVTIDRIVKELRTSKRTLYQHFPDKTELLKACLEVYHRGVRKENEEVIEGSANAIEAMARLHHFIVKRASAVNPNFFNDIIHYYPGLLQGSYKVNGNFARAQLQTLAAWGIEDGIFRDDIDLDVVGKTVLVLLGLLKDDTMFPVASFSKQRLTFGIMLPYLRGMCTPKGLKMVNKQEELFRVNI